MKAAILSHASMLIISHASWPLSFKKYQNWAGSLMGKISFVVVTVFNLPVYFQCNIPCPWQNHHWDSHLHFLHTFSTWRARLLKRQMVAKGKLRPNHWWEHIITHYCLSYSENEIALTKCKRKATKPQMRFFLCWEYKVVISVTEVGQLEITFD